MSVYLFCKHEFSWKMKYSFIFTFKCPCWYGLPKTMPFAKPSFLPPVPFSPVLSHPFTGLSPCWVLFLPLFWLHVNTGIMGFPGGISGEESACQPHASTQQKTKKSKLLMNMLRHESPMHHAKWQKPDSHCESICMTFWRGKLQRQKQFKNL